MTIGIVVKSPEGIVLAADSVLTVTRDRKVSRKHVKEVVNLYRHSKKLHQLADYPVGIISAGPAGIKTRSLESYITQFNNEVVPPQNKNKNYDVSSLASDLNKFIKGIYKTEGGSGSIHFVCAGYSKGSYTPDVFRWQLPEEEPQRFFYNEKESKEGFGFLPIGIGSEWVSRWYFAADDRLEDVLKKHKIRPTKRGALIETIHKELRLDIPISAMPLQDTVDLAVFLINLAIASSRFCVGATTCGGDIDVAVITKKDGFDPLQIKKPEYKFEYGSYA